MKNFVDDVLVDATPEQEADFALEQAADAKASLARVRAEAKAALVAHIDAASPEPQNLSRRERDSLPAKTRAARAMMDGRASIEQVALLTAEAVRMEETPAALAAKVMENAPREVPADLAAAVRRKGFRAIDAAPMLAAVEGALSAARAAFDAEMTPPAVARVL